MSDIETGLSGDPSSPRSLNHFGSAKGGSTTPRRSNNNFGSSDSGGSLTPRRSINNFGSRDSGSLTPRKSINNFDSGDSGSLTPKKSFNHVVTRENIDSEGNVKDKDKEELQYYYYCLAHGNNPMLIKRILLRRPWWKSWVESSERSWNFYWIPYVKRELFNQLKKNGPNVTAINHFEGSYKWLTSKNGMFISLSSYCGKTKKDINTIIPETVLVNEGQKDESYHAFINLYNSYIHRCVKCLKYINCGPMKCICHTPVPFQNIWICKGPNSNQGFDIKIFTKLDDILGYISTPNEAVKYSKQWVLQKYIENPHLYRGRKYDIRVLSFMKACDDGNKLECYIYPDSYLRTSSSFFKLSNYNDDLIHLTNDNVQRGGDHFGTFECANKVLWPAYKKYLIEELGDEKGEQIYISIRKQIQSITLDSYYSVKDVVNPNRLPKCCQMFGYDFMVDTNFKVWLIEINTNPSICYDPVEQPFKELMFPRMIDEYFQLTLDEYFPPLNGMTFAGPDLIWTDCKEFQDELDQGGNRWKLICRMDIEEIKKKDKDQL